MAKSKLHCSVITPERKVLEADVDSVILPAHDGQIGVLKGVLRFCARSESAF